MKYFDQEGAEKGLSMHFTKLGNRTVKVYHKIVCTLLCYYYYQLCFICDLDFLTCLQPGGFDEQIEQYGKIGVASRSKIDITKQKLQAKEKEEHKTQHDKTTTEQETKPKPKTNTNTDSNKNTTNTHTNTNSNTTTIANADANATVTAHTDAVLMKIPDIIKGLAAEVSLLSSGVFLVLFIVFSLCLT